MSDTPQQYVARLVADAATGLDRPRQEAVDALLERIAEASVPGRGTMQSAPLRLAAGLLADEARRRDPGPAPAPRRPQKAPRKGIVIHGAPLAAAATRAANGLPDLRPSRPHAVVILARPLDEAIADVWASRVWGLEDRTWGGLTATLEALDRIPYEADVAEIAAKWVRKLGPEQVHVVTRPGPLVGVTREPLQVVHPPVAAPSVELARVVSQTLGILVDHDTHERILHRVLRPVLPTGPGPGPAVRGKLQPWLRRHADRLTADAAAGGYALHGDPTDLAPRGQGTVRWPGSDHQQPALLEVAVRTLLALCEESP